MHKMLNFFYKGGDTHLGLPTPLCHHISHTMHYVSCITHHVCLLTQCLHVLMHRAPSIVLFNHSSKYKIYIREYQDLEIFPDQLKNILERCMHWSPEVPK